LQENWREARKPLIEKLSRKKQTAKKEKNHLMG
jgi:hypothetical protein